jgi:hypothetical protein
VRDIVCWYVTGESPKGDAVKHHIIAFLLFCSALAWAVPSAPEYNVNVHVSATRMVLEGKSLAYHQNLSVIIDNKKYELESIDATNVLLMLGDYKARLVKDHHGTGSYDSWRVYEFLFPDKRTRQFLVVGESE